MLGALPVCYSHLEEKAEQGGRENGESKRKAKEVRELRRTHGGWEGKEEVNIAVDDRFLRQGKRVKG